MNLLDRILLLDDFILIWGKFQWWKSVNMQKSHAKNGFKKLIFMGWGLKIPNQNI
jgi:hypothetical protein